MPPTITTAERRRRVGVRHRLAASQRSDDVEAVTRSVVALHSSDPASVYLSAVARMIEPSIEAVESALYEKRSIVRHHAMRRTIWVMPIDHACRAYAATTEKVAAAERKRNLQAITVSTDISDPEQWFANATAEVIALLEQHGPTPGVATRDVGQRLPHLAIPLRYGTVKHSATLNAHTKVLQGAGFDGNVVRGRPSSWISAEYPWSTTEDWLGVPLAGMDKRTAAGELVDAWLRQFGPATETDLVWWFGDTKTLIRNALADCNATEVCLDDETPAWVAAGDLAETDEPERWVRLLPGLDPTSMGWKERDWYLDTEIVEPMFDQFGNIGPAIWADGRIVGGWAQREDATVVTELFTPLSNAHEQLLAEAIDELQTIVDGVQVKPRFPARMQKRLLA